MEDIHPYKRDLNTPMHLVDQNLYLGSLMGASKYDLLTSNNISAIVQLLGSDCGVEHHPGIDYYCIEIDDCDFEDISQHFEGALTFILNSHREGKNVFVHCAAGISRSTSIVSAYLMAKYNISFQAAIEKIRLSRSCAEPNKGFIEQLEALNIEELRSHLGFN